MNKNSSDDGEKLAFLNGLHQFLYDKGKVLFPYPRLAGKTIDLHDLYNKVTTLGGYQKVTDKDLWDEFLLEYKFPVISSSLAFGLKTIYQRFLEEYERVHYFGDDEVPKKLRFDSSIRRSRNPVFITEHDRAQFGLSATRLSEPRFAADISDYERIAFSLTSGLPNEVDFAINACTLLSGESRHVLRLSRCPQLLDALLLHAGIFSSDINSFGEIGKTWNEKTGHNFTRFWNETVSDTSILAEMLPENNQSNCQSDEVNCNDSSNSKSICKYCNKVISSDVNELNTESHDKATKYVHGKCCRKKWISIFQSKRCLGVQDYEGQRILQIALVLLNLSFESFNIPLLANNKSLVRFVFLCVHSNYSSLRQTGLDILGNVSASMNIEKLGLNVMQCTYSTVERCIKSRDKFDNIRGFEVLGNLCKSSANKDTLLFSINDDMFKSSVLLLTIGDIELAIAAIEALYTLSKLGEETCTKIAIVPGSIDVLVCLITFNVRTLGASQLSAIRIARKIAPPQPQQIHRVAPQPPTQSYAGARTIHAHQRPTHVMPPHYQAIRPNPTPNPMPAAQMAVSANPAVTHQVHHRKELNRPIGAGPTYTHTETSSIPPVFHYMPAPPPDIVLDKSPESFAQLWVWATYEQCGNDDGSVPRVQLFSDYANAATRYGMSGKNQVLPAAEFGRCLQKVFSNTASRLFNDCNGQPMYHITGIKKRQTPLPVPGYHPQVPINALSVVPPSNHITPHCQGVPIPSSSNTSSSSNVSLNSSAPHRAVVLAVSTPSSASVSGVNQVASSAAVTKQASSISSPVKNLQLPTTTHKNQNGLNHVSNGSSNNGSVGNDLENQRLPTSPGETVEAGETIHTKLVNGTVEAHEKIASIHKHALTSKDGLSVDACKPHCESPNKTDEDTNINCKPVKEALNHKDESCHVEEENKHKNANEVKAEVMCNGFLEDSHQHSPGISQDVTKSKNNIQTHAVNGSLSPPSVSHSKNVPESNSKVQYDHLTQTPSVGNSPERESCRDHEDHLQHSNMDVGASSHGTSEKSSQHKELNEQAQTQVIDEQARPTNLPQNETTIQHSSTKALPSGSAITKPPPISPHSGAVEANEALEKPQVAVKRLHGKEDSAPVAKQPKIEVPATLPPSRPAVAATHHHPTQTSLPLTTPVAHHHSTPVRFPAPKPSAPAPSGGTVHPGQRKPPPIDLMAPNASLMVLFRNSGKQAFEDFSDDKEDPISKSIRLTAALILTNIAKCCDLGRSLLRRHESWFAQLAMSGMDCSPNLAKLLSELDR